MSTAHNILMRMFGRPQGVLGRIGGVIMARTNRAAAVEIVEMLDAGPGDKVLEIGFGPGVGIHLLAEDITHGCVRGIDSSPEMLEQAVTRNAQAIQNGTVELRLGFADKLPFGDNSFDKVLAINSMQVWPDPGAGLREIWRVMKPGAKVALGFTIHSGQPNEGMHERLVAAGFTKVKVVDREKWFCVLASKW
jgi:ubiquinone/menaquinone biosynthesis C-methylase UbiE